VNDRSPVASSHPQVLLVSSVACGHCADAEIVLERACAEGLVDLEVVDAESDRGAALLAQYRPAMFPLVLLDGEFFSAGRLPRGPLARVLGVPRARI
jgi:hypothetical protein